jgi:hypothetical protein
VAEAAKLDPEIFRRWFQYLTVAEKLHPYLKAWDVLMAKGGGTDAGARRISEEFRDIVLKVIPEKKAVIAAKQQMLSDYKRDNSITVKLPGLVQFELFQLSSSWSKVMDTNTFTYGWMWCTAKTNSRT